MLYFGLDVQLRRGSVAGYTTDESWAYGPKEGVEAFESITFFIRFIYAINFEHLLNRYFFYLYEVGRSFRPASFSLRGCCFFAHTVVFSSHLCKKKNGGSSDTHIKKRKLS